jgi:dipeptidyl aminopeptidase/acylaminoacyl peptidase
MFKLAHLTLVTAVLFCVATPATAQRAAKPADIPIADFFKTAAFAQPALSPDGTKIAMLVPGPDGRNALAVADTATPSKRVGVARFSDGDIRSFSWVNDKRLVMNLIDLQAPLGDQVGGGMYAVNADGSDFIFLVGRGRNFESLGHAAIRPLRWNHQLVGVPRDGSDDVIVFRYNLRSSENEPQTITPLRLNTLTRGTREMVKDAPDNAAGWVMDQQLVPRAAISYENKSNIKVHLRKAEGAPWQMIDDYEIFTPKAGSMTPVDFDFDGNLIVSALRNDDLKTSALYRYDIDKKKLDDAPLIAAKGFDVSGPLTMDASTKTMVGVWIDGDAASTEWLDKTMRGYQTRIDALLPGAVNQISCYTRCTKQKLYVVSSRSDTQPPVYFLFDTAKDGKASLQLLGASRPWIDSTQMGQQDMVRIKARDGLEFPAYVTKPKGKGPFPAVILVHGGPNVRGVTWGWDADAQFLASRGYLVVEPEFRGSTGYGDKLFKAGWKQWGLTMQDDITDATHWAVKEGLADPKRLVIAGASYGGYATMMGLVKEPNLYRAGINWVGVTDIELMYTIDWSDTMGSSWQKYGMPQLVGDRTKDAEQFKKTSPLQRAAEITKPVLMAYGTEDIRVPLPHGTKMRDALKAAGKVEVEWVAYENEGHGFLLEKNRVDFWTRVEKFLEKHAK